MRKHKNVKKYHRHIYENWETETYTYKRCKTCHRTIKLRKIKKEK